jgi:hypothetical protein
VATYSAAKDLLVHGGKNTCPRRPRPAQPSSSISPTRAANRPTNDRVGGNGLQTTEGTVTDINRGKKEITIRYDNGMTEKLTLTDRAAVDAGQDFKDQAVAPRGCRTTQTRQEKDRPLLQAEELSAFVRPIFSLSASEISQLSNHDAASPTSSNG